MTQVAKKNGGLPSIAFILLGLVSLWAIPKVYAYLSGHPSILTAYDLGATGYDIAYGSGFVNTDSAVRRAIAIAAGAA